METTTVTMLILLAFLTGYVVGILRAKYDAAVDGFFSLMGSKYSVQRRFDWNNDNDK